jgi:hypothetical protein
MRMKSGRNIFQPFAWEILRSVFPCKEQLRGSVSLTNQHCQNTDDSGSKDEVAVSSV